MTYEEKTGDYFLTNIGSPTKLSFDARAIKADNLLYSLDEITWDLDSDGDVDHRGKTFDYTINTDGSYSVSVNYLFTHRRNKEDVINMSQRIYVEASEKEAIITLNIKPDSEYAPANVVFDASESKVKDDNIVKFVYDYGDGIVEERDALNLGHRYLKEGNYIVKLTVVTQKGKEYTTSKNLVLKPQATTVNMSSSLSRAPVGQEISFFSAGTQGQITRYYWDFGDGFSSTEANPSYAYKAPGKYSVTLTLDFINNNTLSEKLEVEIYENEE
jgi:PKD repeat protein